MSELMPCQMCGADAHFAEGGDVQWEKFDQVACDYCWISGEAFTWDSSRGVASGPDFMAFILAQQEKNRPLAARAWNEMQTLIARGKLLDTPSPPTTKARL